MNDYNNVIFYFLYIIVDVNECLLFFCGNNSFCVNIYGGFVCVCLYGYYGDLCEIGWIFKIW